MFFLGFRDGPRAMGIRVVFNVRGTGTVRAGRKGLTLLTEFLNETADIAGFCIVERAILLLSPVKLSLFGSFSCLEKFILCCLRQVGESFYRALVCREVPTLLLDKGCVKMAGVVASPAQSSGSC